MIRLARIDDLVYNADEYSVQYTIHLTSKNLDAHNTADY